MSLEHSPSRDTSDKTSLKDDLLFGAQAIADYIGVRPPSRVLFVGKALYPRRESRRDLDVN